jgi:ATP-dependent Clp protease ATP-binding subunit ClpA
MTIAGTKRVLDLTKRSPSAAALVDMFNKRIVGQDEAVAVLADIVETYQSGMCDPKRPAGVALFMGRSGCGKTSCVEAACEALFGDPNACVKISCGEFNMEHSVAKLVGSPPGYLGFRETKPMLEQERLNKYHTEKLKLSFLLVDELEKASDTLYQLLLGVLDRAELTLGDNREVNFSQTVIVMTSNLGAGEMSTITEGKGIGYHSATTEHCSDQKIRDIALSAARRKFTPEFLNRIDHTVVFNTLTPENIRTILAMELGKVQQTIFNASHTFYYLTPEARAVILEEGYSKTYGARNLKRTIERRVRIPLSRLLASNQVMEGETIIIDYIEGQEDFQYSIGGTRTGADIRAVKPEEGDILQ